ncbi:hypothetical protein DXG01_007201 [Tephrocybe rancida]|nr:hypothetical protein DXG01_007201 [Tephrocybe rancida]
MAGAVDTSATQGSTISKVDTTSKSLSSDAVSPIATSPLVVHVDTPSSPDSDMSDDELELPVFEFRPRTPWRFLAQTPS